MDTNKQEKSNLLSPVDFINKSYDNFTLFDLQDALVAFSKSISETKGRLSTLIPKNFARFIACKNTLENINVRHENYSENTIDEIINKVERILRANTAVFNETVNNTEHEELDEQRELLRSNIVNFKMFVENLNTIKKTKGYSPDKFKDEIREFLAVLFDKIINKSSSFEEACELSNIYLSVSDNYDQSFIDNNVSNSIFDDIQRYSEDAIDNEKSKKDAVGNEDSKKDAVGNEDSKKDAVGNEDSKKDAIDDQQSKKDAINDQQSKKDVNEKSKKDVNEESKKDVNEESKKDAIGDTQKAKDNVNSNEKSKQDVNEKSNNNDSMTSFVDSRRRIIVSTLFINFKHSTYSAMNPSEEYYVYLFKSLTKILEYLSVSEKEDAIHHVFHCFFSILSKCDIKYCISVFKRVEDFQRSIKIDSDSLKEFKQCFMDLKIDVFDIFINQSDVKQYASIFKTFLPILGHVETKKAQEILLKKVQKEILRNKKQGFEYLKVEKDEIEDLVECLGSKESRNVKQLERSLRERRNVEITKIVEGFKHTFESTSNIKSDTINVKNDTINVRSYTINVRSDIKSDMSNVKNDKVNDKQDNNVTNKTHNKADNKADNDVTNKTHNKEENDNLVDVKMLMEALKIIEGSQEYHSQILGECRDLIMKRPVVLYFLHSVLKVEAPSLSEDEKKTIEGLKFQFGHIIKSNNEL